MMTKIDLESMMRFLEESIKRTETELEKLKGMVPVGTKLRAAKHGDDNKYQYFLKTDENGRNGRYIKNEEIKTAAMLAQIEYDEKLLTVLRKNTDVVSRCKKTLITDPFSAALNEMTPGKRMLVKPLFVTDETFVEKWKSQEYEGLSFKSDYPEYYTRNGLRVRSKSEVIIADMLDEMSVPFLYEKPLRLNSGTVHPDFTLLNCRERREVYWEHFGMMDDMDYRNNAFAKIRNYESNELYQHDCLIWTFETGKYPLNTKEIRKMIKALKGNLGYGHIQSV